MLNVSVVGTGYVGLVTGACLAEIGHRVVCADSDRGKIAGLLQGRMPIYEPGLEEIVRRNLARKRLGFVCDLAEGLGGEELVLFVAVGTPTGEDGSADLAALFAVVEEASRRRRALRPDGFTVLVVKSTVPVGTCRRLQAIAGAHLPAGRFAVVSNPEFLREGCAVRDFMHPDRIVVGSDSPRARALMLKVYAPLTGRGHRLLEVSSFETSEMIKYASNVFLATKIGLINEFSRLCEKVGADVEELALGLAGDHRIGGSCLKAGPGFGGSCFPKDLRALVTLAGDHASPMLIAEAVIASNERQKRAMSVKILNAFDGDVRGLRIAVLGLSFKAGTDDVRETPALTIIAALVEAGAEVSAFDPAAASNAARWLPDVDYAACAEEAAIGAHAVVVVTEWPEFRELDWRALARGMARRLVIDLRNLLDPDEIARSGCDYIALGRGRFAGESVWEPVPLAAALDDLAARTPAEDAGPLDRTLAAAGAA